MNPRTVALTYLGLHTLALWWFTHAALGDFVFPLDDSYIHLGMARALVEGGTWGFRPGEFTPASSSPLWTLLLALPWWFRIDLVTAAIVLNGIAVAALISRADDWMLRQGSSLLTRTIALLSAIISAPLPALILTGMEHSLHAWWIWEVLLLSVAVLTKKRRVAGLVLLCFLGTTIRYESLAVIGALSLILLWQRRPLPAVGVGLGGALPIVLHGWVATMRGWPFLPSGMAAKSPLTRGGFPEAIRSTAHSIIETPIEWPMLTLLGVGALGLVMSPPDRRRQPTMLILYLAAVSGQILVSGMGRLYRFDAALVAIGCVLMVALSDRLQARWRSAAVVSLLLLGIFRTVETHTIFLQQTRIIGRNSLQAARLVRDLDLDVVACWDIGLISYLTDARIVDMAGLADRNVMNLIRSGQYSSTTLQQHILQRGAALAITFPVFLEIEGDGVPPEWIPVAHLHDPDLDGKGLRLTVYATHTDNAAAVEARLSGKRADLPENLRLLSTDLDRK
ncbi:MAG: hypothetical protein AAFV53_01450 [Myxococcota bacterium]